MKPNNFKNFTAPQIFIENEEDFDLDDGPININLPYSMSMTDEQKSGINLFESAAFKCGISKLNKSAVPY